MTKKQRLREQFLEPKKRLREERLKREYTEMYMADLIGLKNSKGYSEKEDGLQPFKDYEMAIISKKFGISEAELFFLNKNISNRDKLTKLGRRMGWKKIKKLTLKLLQG